jgi:catechol 2,3-dioxygenase-like lactoylglutathione lyase family enzyme
LQQQKGFQQKILTITLKGSILMNSSPAILGLNHIQIEAPTGCEDAARAFFGELLGLAEIEKPANLRGRGGVWFACGVQQIHIGVVADFVPRRKGHPALEVRDLAGWRDRLTAAGVAITEDTPLPGWQRFYIADPWGNRLELLERDSD